MSVDQTGLATRFFALMGSGDLAGALELTTDDFTWRVPGKSDGAFRLAGTYDKARLPTMLARVAQALPAGPRIEILSLTEDEVHAFIEAHVTGTSVDGTAYDNDVVYAMDIRHGKISAAREYLDTNHAAEVFLR